MKKPNYKKLTVKIILIANTYIIAQDKNENIYRFPIAVINNRQIIGAHTTTLYVKKSFLDSLNNEY